jgi:CRISPR-associated protein Csb2
MAAVPFDPGLIVLRKVGGRMFSLESCSMIAETLRDTLLKRHGPNAPEWLTGHRPDGTPTTMDRPAIFPLGFVDHKHADGHLLGVAIAIPQNFPAQHVELHFDLLLKHDDPSHKTEDPQPYLKLVVKNPVLQRKVGDCELELDERPYAARPFTLRSDTWTGPATLWATATPLMLPQFPRRGLTPEEVVARACRDAGYPDPVEVRTSFASVLFGAPHSRSYFARPQRKGRPPRPLIHAVVEFAAPTQGPVLIGAGRYNGFGVCRPLKEENEP